MSRTIHHKIATLDNFQGFCEFMICSFGVLLAVLVVFDALHDVRLVWAAIILVALMCRIAASVAIRILVARA